MDRHILVLTIDLYMASIRCDNSIHQGLHGTDLNIQVWVLCCYLVNDQCVLRVQIDGQAFHFEDFSDFTSYFGSVMKDGISFCIDCLEIQFTKQYAKSCLTHLVSSLISIFLDIFKPDVYIFYIHCHVI